MRKSIWFRSYSVLAIACDRRLAGVRHRTEAPAWRCESDRDGESRREPRPRPGGAGSGGWAGRGEDTEVISPVRHAARSRLSRRRRRRRGQDAPCDGSRSSTRRAGSARRPRPSTSPRPWPLAGKRVCVLDLDPQAHASTHLGVEPDGTLPSLYDVLVSNKPLADVRRAGRRQPVARPVGHQPRRRRGGAGRHRRPRGDPARGDGRRTREPFDFVLMDCGPSLGVLTLNALAAADEVFIPLQPHFLALHGLASCSKRPPWSRRRINPRLKVTGVVVCLYDAATKLAQEVVSDLTAFLEQSRGANVPWANGAGVRHEDPAEHQARRVPELRQDRVRLRPEEPRRGGLRGAGERGARAASPVVVGPVRVTVRGRTAGPTDNWWNRRRRDASVSDPEAQPA